ncbi:unnamed protein product [Prunus armeniaca]|uniref:Uncharacterized protein n=1 Tax=Prunus armeniaca TaxID=36596 RepID=A0A6J5VU64_PRUAR|nr:unnamed protein product [Prunus armeniaca]
MAECRDCNIPHCTVASYSLFLGFGICEGMGTDRLLLAAVGPPIKRRAGLRRKQAGRGSYRGS